MRGMPVILMTSSQWRWRMALLASCLKSGSCSRKSSIVRLQSTYACHSRSDYASTQNDQPASGIRSFYLHDSAGSPQSFYSCTDVRRITINWHARSIDMSCTLHIDKHTWEPDLTPLEASWPVPGMTAPGHSCCPGLAPPPPTASRQSPSAWK